jgi:hypothetical protein
MQNIYDYMADIDQLPTRRREAFPDIDDESFWRLYDIGKRFSMVHVTGFFNLWTSIRYVVEKDIPGDFVECGVWLGGASIFAALAFDFLGCKNRMVHLYDTFAGFPPNSSDFDLRQGKQICGPQYANFRKAVETNIQASGVRQDVYRLAEGPVEETLKSGSPAQISILRLDTDHYVSTRAEMNALFPALSEGGVLIVDDYGIFAGARRAVDEYLAATNTTLMLMRIDEGIRTALKV